MRVLLIILVTFAPALPLVNVFPNGVVVFTVGSNTTIACLPLNGLSINSIQWLVNGTSLERRNLANVDVVFFGDVGLGSGFLQFTNLPREYNSTRIECVADVTSDVRLSVDSTLILLQGRLGAVDSLTLTVQDSLFLLNWTAPFSLDIPDVDPDIEGYCVDVVASSATEQPLYSSCGISTTNFNFSIPPMTCSTLFVSVTPVNVVGNGTSSSLSYHQTQNRSVVDEVFCMSIPGEIGRVQAYFISMSAPVCSAELTFMDVFDSGGQPITTRHTTNITFTSEMLPVNHLYDVTVVASNLAGPATTHVTISTRDVVASTITETSVNMVETTVVYCENSDVSGALSSLVFITDNGDVDFGRSFLVALDRNTSHNHTLPFDLYPGHYRVYVYDIEHDGTLFNGVGYPASANELFTSENSRGSPFHLIPLNIERCLIRNVFGQLISECIFHSDATATRFQVIVQLIDSNEVYKLHVNQSMDQNTPVVVQVGRNGMYQVTILAITEGRGMLDSSVEYTEQVMVNDIPDTSTATSDTSVTAVMTTAVPSLSETGQSVILYILLVLGIILSVALVMLIVLMRKRIRRWILMLRSRGAWKVNRVSSDIADEEEARTSAPAQLQVFKDSSTGNLYHSLCEDCELQAETMQDHVAERGYYSERKRSNFRGAESRSSVEVVGDVIVSQGLDQFSSAWFPSTWMTDTMDHEKFNARHIPSSRSPIVSVEQDGDEIVVTQKLSKGFAKLAVSQDTSSTCGNVTDESSHGYAGSQLVYINTKNSRKLAYAESLSSQWKENGYWRSRQD